MDINKSDDFPASPQVNHKKSGRKKVIVLAILIPTLFLGAGLITYSIINAAELGLESFKVDPRHHSALVKTEVDSLVEIPVETETANSILPYVINGGELFDWTEAGLGEQITTSNGTVSRADFTWGQNVGAYLSSNTITDQVSPSELIPTVVSLVNYDTLETVEILEINPTETENENFGLYDLNFSEDHSKLAITSTNNLWIFNMETYQLFQYELPENLWNSQITSPLFSENGNQILMTFPNGEEKRFAIYDTESLSLQYIEEVENVVGWAGIDKLITVKNNNDVSEFYSYDIATSESVKIDDSDGFYIAGKKHLDNYYIVSQGIDSDGDSIQKVEILTLDDNKIRSYFKANNDQKISIENIYPTDGQLIYFSGNKQTESGDTEVITKFDSQTRIATIYVDGARL